MADIRIKDLATTASSTAADDFLAVDGTTNGTRKLSAATPSFATSVTVPGVSGPTATDLTLTGGSTGASLVLGQGANGNATITPSGTGKILSGTTGSEGGVGLSAFSVGTATGLGGTAYRVSSFYSTAAAAADRPGVILGFDTAGAGVIAAATQATGQPLAFWTYNGSAWGERLRLTSTGNLLIGTTTDGGQKLQVAGDIRVNHTGSAVIDINSTAAAGSATRFLNSGTVFGYLGSGKYVISNSYDIASIALATSGAQSLYLGTNGTTALTLASNQAATFAGAVTVPAAGSLFFGADATYGNSLKLTDSSTTRPSLLAGVSESSGTYTARSATPILLKLASDAGVAVMYVDSGKTPGNTYTPTPVATFGATSTTFAGAVTIGNTVATAVAVASTHKVTMVIGGVTYYLLASNV